MEEKSGTGFQPVRFSGVVSESTGQGEDGCFPDGGGRHGQDDRATGEGHSQVGRGTRVQIRHGAYLPHLTKDGATYAVTFRLGDSLPQQVLDRWKRERLQIIRCAEEMGRPLTSQELERLNVLHGERVETYLDSGVGACHMRDPRVARLVEDALQFFVGSRYELYCWAVMPNHVHIVLRPMAGHALPSVVHAWKSFTSNQANRILGLKGSLWQPEYYDHLIRSQGDLAHHVSYTVCNPQKAGLESWEWVGFRDEGGVIHRGNAALDVISE